METGHRGIYCEISSWVYRTVWKGNWWSCEYSEQSEKWGSCTADCSYQYNSTHTAINKQVLHLVKYFTVTQTVILWFRAHVWYICGCWPSCHVWYICGCWHSCHVFCRFWEPPRAGEVLPKFWVDANHFCPFLQEGDLWEGLGDPDRLRRRCRSSCTASARHCTDSAPPRYPDLTATLGITPLSVCDTM
jgi:hypothetical protein